MDCTRRDGRLLLLGITLIACLALLALGIAAPQAKAADVGYTYYLTGDPADAVATTQPGLILAGGATDQDAAVQWWLGRAGGGDVVVIAASGVDDYASVPVHARRRRLGRDLRPRHAQGELRPGPARQAEQG